MASASTRCHSGVTDLPFCLLSDTLQHPAVDFEVGHKGISFPGRNGQVENSEKYECFRTSSSVVQFTSLFGSFRTPEHTPIKVYRFFDARSAGFQKNTICTTGPRNSVPTASLVSQDGGRGLRDGGMTGRRRRRRATWRSRARWRCCCRCGPRSAAAAAPGPADRLPGGTVDVSLWDPHFLPGRYLPRK